MTQVEIRNAVYKACQLAGKISKENGLPSDYKKLGIYKEARFSGDVFAYSGGSGNIDAGLIGMTDFGITIAFRGTDGTEDWINDIKAEQVASPYCEGKVHKGFLGSVQNLETNMLKKLVELLSEHENSKVYFTGHSKGGALATLMPLAACKRLQLDNDCIEVFSFGSPRVGDKDFSDSYKLTHSRYESFLDIVAHLPMSEQEQTVFKRYGTFMEKYDWLPEFLKFDPYKHVGKRVAFKREFDAVMKYLNLPMESDNAHIETLNSFSSVIRFLPDGKFSLFMETHCYDYDNMPDSI